MVFTGYFKTEQVSGGKVTGWSDVDTSINQPVTKVIISSLILGQMKNTEAAIGTTIYMQNEASDLGGVYKILNTTIWGGPDTAYSGTDTAVPIYVCASAATIFTSDQDFSEHNVLWTVDYNGKADEIDEGYNAFLDFKFYKRDAGGTETFLFTIRGTISDFYEISAMQVTGYPAGSVATTDRLVIKVYFGEVLPG